MFPGMQGASGGHDEPNEMSSSLGFCRSPKIIDLAPLLTYLLTYLLTRVLDETNDDGPHELQY